MWIERGYLFQVSCTLWKLVLGLPVAQRVEMAQCTLDAYSPLVLPASAPLDKLARECLRHVGVVITANTESIYMAELMRRILLACAPSSAAALIRLLWSTLRLASHGYSDMLARLSQDDDDLGRAHDFRALMRAVLSIGAAL